MKKRVLLLGSNSKINREFIKNFKRKYEIFSTAKNPNQINQFKVDLPNEIYIPKNLKFDAAILSASITNQKYCEENYEISFKTNVLSQIKIIDFLGKKGCKLIFPSTNMVFPDNSIIKSEKTKKIPKNNYGFFKSIVEEYLLNSNYDFNIIRFTKIIFKNDLFFSNWINEIKNNNKVTAFSNHYISPISINFCLDKIDMIIQKKISSSIVHLSSSDKISYFECIKYLSKKYNLNSNLISSNLAPKNIKITNSKLECNILKKLNFKLPKSLDAVDLV